MSPSAKNVTPESKPTKGLVGVFKSITGIRSTRIQNSQSHTTTHQYVTETSGLRHGTPRGVPDHESLYEHLKPGNSPAHRIAAAEALRYTVQQLPVSGVTSIFKRAKDLIDPLNPAKARAAGFELLTECAKNTDLSDPERLAYFRVLTTPGKFEDLNWQLNALIELTKHGRNLAGFHYETLPVLTSWLRQIWAAALSHRKKALGMASFRQKTDLTSLLIFIVEIIKFSFNVSNEQNIGDLIEVVLNICILTQTSDDLCPCINVINAIVTYGDIPTRNLAGCVKVLCSLNLNATYDVQKEAWKSIRNICISHNGKNTVRIIFSILCDPQQETKQNVREIRGALLVSEKLFAENGENGFPFVPFSLLIKSVSNVASVGNLIIRNDILRLILSLMNGDRKGMLKNVMEEDWALMFDVINRCVNHDLKNSEYKYATNPCVLKSSVDEEEVNIASIKMSQNLHSLILRIQTLLIQHSNSDFFQKLDCVKFLLSMHKRLPETCARLVIDLHMEYRFCYPSDSDWRDNIMMILRTFFYNHLQSTEIRLHALKAVTEVFYEVEAVNEYAETETTHMFLDFVLKQIGNEKDLLILQEIITLVVTVADATLDNNFFFFIIDTIHESIISKCERLHSISSSFSRENSPIPSQPDSYSTPYNINQTPSNLIAKAFIQIFISCIDKSRIKVMRTFEEILWIAKNDECEPDARISALGLLFRIRADWANRIFLIISTESNEFNALLHQTPRCLPKNQINITFQQRTSRVDNSTPLLRSSLPGSRNIRESYIGDSTTSSQRTFPHIYHTWLGPNSDPSTQLPSCKTSSIFVSVLDSKCGRDDIYDKLKFSKCGEDENINTPTTQAVPYTDDQPITLNIPEYLQVIIDLFQNSCNWEIYSNILLYLPSQLTNHALFKAAIPQIRILRGVLCNQIKNNSIQEPPTSCGLRKSDVSIFFFRALNVVMSYHRYFSKNDEDDIVRTFLHGVGEKTSRCCIHSLSICCHELPGSTSKLLVTILTKMSQIITQSHVAIHILEFLACLARLPNLYVNFREEEYRIVFAISFRYLQYVQDKKSGETLTRSNTLNPKIGSENSRACSEISSTENILLPTISENLPEYVCALAYHVIILWFLSLKLADRAGQVHWIANNLVSTDANGKESIDELAQVTLDFMQRVAYADVEESGPDPSFNKEIFGDINRKRWVVGNSLLTIEQTTRGDWAQITKHQPSGTSCYIIQKKISPPQPHQAREVTDAIKDAHHFDENIKLPSHLLLQLCTSIPISAESMRPIPIPDCKAVDRAVSNLDRTFTVDGHKVGVIYIGENQTNEVEILANIQGSSDYTCFLSGLGTLTKLRGASFNTQGLDRHADTDGEYTFCWRDRLSEIVFHVTTQMPTDLYNDPQCSNKKKHIGNDFVNIIFNNSGLPFNFNTFPSEFNYVYIVITPESRATFVARRLELDSENVFYKVQVMSKPGFPEISPAAEAKIMRLSNLPDFVRLLALNASVFSSAWDQRGSEEHFSSWRCRLREIKKMRETFGTKNLSSSPPGTSHGVVTEGRNVRGSINSLRRLSIANFLTPGEPVSQRPLDTNICETEIRLIPNEENLLESLDFSRWA